MIAEKIKAKRFYWGHEVGARRYLLEYFLLLPINLIRFALIFIFNKKRGYHNIVVFQNLNERYLLVQLQSFSDIRFFGLNTYRLIRG